jgi:hypothetical protein
LSNAISPRLQAAYEAVNVSGHVYGRLLSQQALLIRSKRHVDGLSGTVYRPEQAREASFDSRGLPVSTVIDVRTAFWQGATARAAAQRTVSAVGMALGADALGVNGPAGLARWGNFPLAVVMRAALPLRVAAWPAVLWNQDLAVGVLGSYAGALRGTTLGSGFAEYVVGTGWRDRPDAPQVSPGYMVLAPPAFEDFKSHGLLGVPEQLLLHGAQRLAGPDRPAAAEGADARPSWSQRAAQGCMLGAIALRAVSQAFRLPLCAVWICELALGGLVGVAHVSANHAMQLTVLGAQQLGAWIGLAEAPSRPMWQNLDDYRADHAQEISEDLVNQKVQHLENELEVLEEVAPQAAPGGEGEAAPEEKQGLASSAAQQASTSVQKLLPRFQHEQKFEQL